MTMQDVEVWVLVDNDGAYVASDDQDALNERYEEHHQAVADAAGIRRIKITVKVPLPEVIEVSGSVNVTEEIGELRAV